MQTKYNSFMDEVKEQFPEIAKSEQENFADSSVYATLNDYIRAQSINFQAKRKDLYRLSMMLEKYATENKVPLLATFETESLYKYVEKRYIDILNKLPKSWVIGGFDDPFLVPPNTVPNTTEVLTCAGTNIEKMWIVITKGPQGPFGLVAEDLGEDRFRGFFSMDKELIEKVIQKLNGTLRIDIDFSESKPH